MAIVKMSKFNLFSFDYDRAKLLKNLQKFEYVHFNDLKENGNEEYEGLDKVKVTDEISEINEDFAKAKWAINILNNYIKKPGTVAALKEGQKEYTFDQLNKMAESFDFEGHYNSLKDVSDRLNAKEQDLQKNEGLIEELQPWKNLKITISDFNEFDKVVAVSGTIPTKNMELVKESIKDLESSYLETISSVDNTVYVIGLSTEDEGQELVDTLRKLGFAQVTLKGHKKVQEEIDDLENKVKLIREDIADIQDEMKEKTKDLENFQIFHDYLENKQLKISSGENFLKTEKVNIIEGYVPTNKVDKFKKVINKELEDRYYLEVKDADKEDPNVPIILENNKFTGAFENMTEMYALPKYNEIDPTPLFAPFYAFFSGMMVGDLGYGLIVFIATLLILKTCNLSNAQKKSFRFFNYLSIGAMFWGAIYGSFMGGIIELPGLIDPAKDSMTVIGLSLIFGGIHLFFALGIKGYLDIRDGKPFDAVLDTLSWYLALGGLIAMLLTGPLELSQTVKTVGKVCLIIGLILVAIGGTRGAESIGGKIGSALNDVYGITGYIGDFVSYLRLMALGLSGSFIALAVNMISQMMFNAGILGKFGAVIIFVVFQLFNIFLSYLSAYVHSARLIYVEMFNKFYEGGGKPFKKLIAKSNYFRISNQNN